MLADGYGEDCPAELPEPPAAIAPELGELPIEGCVPGSMADVALEGLWYAEVIGMGAFGSGDPSGPVRISRKCGSVLATNDAYADWNADRLYWGSAYRYDEELYYGEAFGACRVESDGSLWGHTVATNWDSGPTYRTFTARRFGWIEGEPEDDGLELVARWDGPPQTPWPEFRAINVRVHREIAYLITREGLRIVDVSTPSTPRDLGWYPARDDQFNDVKLVGGADGVTYAILGSNNYGVVIVDVSRPDRAEEVRRFDPTALSSGTHTLFTQVRGATTLAYFVSGSEPTLAIYDVTDPSHPVAHSRYEGLPFGIFSAFHDLYVEGDRAYVNATGNGLLVFDVSNPAAPRVIGRTEGDLGYSHSNWVTVAGGRKVSVHGDEGRGSFVRIIDVDEASPEFMETIGEFRLREQVSVHNIIAVGERAYVAYYQNGLRVLDLSDPTRPRQIAHYNTWDPERARGVLYEGAFGVDIDDRGLIYVADSESGLLILREKI